MNARPAGFSSLSLLSTFAVATTMALQPASVSVVQAGGLPPLATDAQLAEAPNETAIMEARRRAQGPHKKTMAVDGDFADWAGLDSLTTGIAPRSDGSFVDLGHVWAAFDDQWVYLRFETGRQVNLQGLGEGSIVILFDLDGNPFTGADDNPSRQSMIAGPRLTGVDLKLVFSPGRDDQQTRGVSAYTVENGVPEVAINPYELAASFAPTFTSSESELRLRRAAPLRGNNVLPFVASSFRAQLLAVDRNNVLIDQTGPFTVRLEPMDAAARSVQGRADSSSLSSSGSLDVDKTARRAQLVIARTDPNTVRFVSWNVENGKMFARPGPFNSILRALRPDVICFQELGGESSGRRLRGWLEDNLPAPYGWEVAVSDDSGTGVASRLSALQVGPDRMPEVGNDHRLRATTMIVGKGQRRVLVTSVHLKCCGRAGDSRDRQRIDEADKLRRLLREVRTAESASGVVIMGDLNLVGSRAPLDTLRLENDLNGSDLLVVDLVVLNDSTNATWRDGGQPFLPGRLDYTLVSDSVLRIVHSFVLDTARLDDTTLAAFGLQLNDSVEASDHLPMIVDLAW